MSKMLGEILKRARAMSGVTLREAEKATSISNAYLSQLENGKVEQPSPHVLHQLAEFYSLPYPSLMEAAGYLTDAGHASKAKTTSALQVALMSATLTEAEEKLVADYVEFLRSQRRKQAGGKA